MSAVLGVSANYHDAAAALVIDGQVIAAMQEERFSRVKNDPSLPLHAISSCLKMAKIEAGALDAVVFYENPYAKLERVLTSALRNFPRSFWQFPKAMASQLGGKVWVLDALASALKIDRRKVEFRAHHASHAASAFFMSPFANAAVLTIDAVGEQASTAIWRGEGTKLEHVESLSFPHSLGLLYAAITAFLGFEVNEGEYKVMGLSAFGRPSLRDEFHELFALTDEGTFSLDLDYFDSHTDTELGFGPALEALLGARRPLGKAWDLTQPEDQHFADVAATLQVVTEEAIAALAARARRITGCEALCLAGGVALNAVANSKLRGPLFVQPAAGDAGGALGAALLGAIARDGRRPPPMTSASLGETIDVQEVISLATSLGLQTTRVSDPSEEAATRLENGEVLAFVQGRFEWGPRSLGHRSLLALPTPVDVKERINNVIKRREPFRPFAPAVLQSAALDYFGPHAELLAPFMVTVASVKDPASLAAVTHVDGTARLQTVREETPFGAVLSAVKARTGSPIVLNTSLNGKGEPIVAGAADALHFFLTHPIQTMLVEDVLVTKKADASSPRVTE